MKEIIQFSIPNGHKIGAFQTDNDSVYAAGDVKRLLDAHVIRDETTVPYTPQQSGAAERRVRTITETANALIQQVNHAVQVQKLDPRLWADACANTAYVHTRTWKQRIGGIP